MKKIPLYLSNMTDSATPSAIETDDKTIIIFRESLVQSILSDAGTYGFMIGTVWFNQKFIGGSYFLNGIILVMLTFFLFAKAKHKLKTFTSKKQIIDYLNKDS